MRLCSSALLLSLLLESSAAWIQQNTNSHPPDLARRRKSELYGFPNPFENFRWGRNDKNEDANNDWQNSNGGDEGYADQEFYDENTENERWEHQEQQNDMSYDEEYSQYQDDDHYWYDNQDQEQQQQQSYDDFYNENSGAFYDENDTNNQRYDDENYQQQQEGGYPQENRYSEYSSYDDQEQYQHQEQHYENNESNGRDNRFDSSQMHTRDEEFSNPQDDVMNQNYGYSSGDSIQAQQDYYYQNPRSRRGGRGSDWKVSIEQGRFRPPQMGAMNRRRRQRSLYSSPLDFFFDDLLESPFDRILSSPFDDFFASPFSTRRRRRPERPRNRVSTSPFSTMMMDLAVPPRVFDPFFDEAMEDQMQSMMARRRNMMERANGDPAFQRRVLEQAERYLNSDIACTTALGQPIQMGPIVSQSSSFRSYRMNGRESRQEENMMQVSVRGRQGGGVVRIVATDSGIQNMILQVGEGANGYPPREINVQLSSNPAGSPPPPGNSGNNNSNNGGGPEIMDAEIVEHNRRVPSGSY